MLCTSLRGKCRSPPGAGFGRHPGRGPAAGFRPRKKLSGQKGPESGTGYESSSMACLTRSRLCSLPSSSASSMPPPGRKGLARQRHAQGPQHHAVFDAHFFNQGKEGVVQALLRPVVNRLQNRQNGLQGGKGVFAVGLHLFVAEEGGVILGQPVEEIDLLGDFRQELAARLQQGGHGLACRCCRSECPCQARA